MSNCKLQTLYFAATEFEVLDEFEGEKGFFIKSFLINNKLNLNDWEVTEEANRLDGPEFKGMPGIEFFNKGRRDHTVGSTYVEALRLQSPHAKGIIRKVIGTETGEKLTQVSRIFDEEMIEKIKKARKEGKKMFVSPAIFPRSIDDVQIIDRPEGGHIHRVHRYLPLHYAFVDEPAYGGDAAITDVCEGADCLIKLAKTATDGIGQDDIDPLRTIPIIRVSKCSKTGKINVSVAGDDELSKLVSECLSKKLGEGEEPTDQELAICFSEARKKLKSNTSKIHQSKNYGKKMSNVEITEEKKKNLDARLTALEDTETKRKEEEAKKAKQKKAVETEDNHEKDMLEATDNDDDLTDKEKEEARKKAKKGKKAVDEKETEKEKEQTAKIASMNDIINTEIKLPKIASYLEYRASVGDTEEVIETKRAKLLKGSIEDINEKLEEVAPHMASMQFNTESKQKSGTTKYPYGLGGTQLSGSANTKSAEEMYQELYE